MGYGRQGWRAARRTLVGLGLWALAGCAGTGFGTNDCHETRTCQSSAAGQAGTAGDGGTGGEGDAAGQAGALGASEQAGTAGQSGSSAGLAGASGAAGSSSAVAGGSNQAAGSSGDAGQTGSSGQAGAADAGASGQAAAPLGFVTEALPSLLLNTEISIQLVGEGGTGELSYESLGGLVDGLVLAADGTLSGSPVATGTFSWSVQLSDQAGEHVSRDFDLVVLRSHWLAYRQTPDPLSDQALFLVDLTRATYPRSQIPSQLGAGADVGLVVWSPQGNALAYTVDGTAADRQDLYLVRLDSSTPSQPVPLYQSKSVGSAIWSDDGNTLAFATDNEIRAVDLSGTQPSVSVAVMVGATDSLPQQGTFYDGVLPAVVDNNLLVARRESSGAFAAPETVSSLDTGAVAQQELRQSQGTAWLLLSNRDASGLCQSQLLFNTSTLEGPIDVGCVPASPSNRVVPRFEADSAEEDPVLGFYLAEDLEGGEPLAVLDTNILFSTESDIEGSSRWSRGGGVLGWPSSLNGRLHLASVDPDARSVTPSVVAGTYDLRTSPYTWAISDNEATLSLAVSDRLWVSTLTEYGASSPEEISLPLVASGSSSEVTELALSPNGQMLGLVRSVTSSTSVTTVTSYVVSVNNGSPGVPKLASPTESSTGISVVGWSPDSVDLLLLAYPGTASPAEYYLYDSSTGVVPPVQVSSCATAGCSDVAPVGFSPWPRP